MGKRTPIQPFRAALLKTGENSSQILQLQIWRDEVDEIMAMVRDKMETVHKLQVPLIADVGVGQSWAEAH